MLGISMFPILICEYCFLFFSVLTFFIGLLFSPVTYSSRLAWSITLVSSVFALINYLVVLNYNLKFNLYSNLYDAGTFQSGSLYFIKIASVVCLILIALTGLTVTRNLFSLEFIVLLTFGEVSTLFILSFDHVLLILIFVEIQALIGYILTIYKRSSPFATEASLKYFLLGGVSSAILLLSLSLMQAGSGSFYASEIADCFSRDALGSLNSLTYGDLSSFTGYLFLFGMFFKLSAAPLHFWTPDVYEDVEYLTIGYFATIPKLAVIGLLSSTFYFLVLEYNTVFLEVGILSVVVGAVNGLYQFSIKRLLAFSTILNTGYILIIFSMSSYTASFVGDLVIFSVYFQACLYAVSVVALTSLLQFTPDVSNFNNLSNLFYMPLSFKAVIVGSLFSIASIPPFIGFFSKALILYNIVCTGSNIILLVFVPLLSLVSQYYYARLVAGVFFKPLTLSVRPLSESTPSAYLYFLVFFIFSLNLLAAIFVYVVV